MSAEEAMIERFNGVEYKGKFYPFKTILLYPTHVSVAPHKNTRYFIYSFSLYARLVAADTTTFIESHAVKNGTTDTIGFLETIPSVAGAYYVDKIVRSLYDVEAPIVISTGTADPTHWGGLYIVAEVDDTP